jgi:hypothetical protein
MTRQHKFSNFAVDHAASEFSLLDVLMRGGVRCNVLLVAAATGPCTVASMVVQSVRAFAGSTERSLLWRPFELHISNIYKLPPLFGIRIPQTGINLVYIAVLYTS